MTLPEDDRAKRHNYQLAKLTKRRRKIEKNNLRELYYRELYFEGLGALVSNVTQDVLESLLVFTGRTLALVSKPFHRGYENMVTTQYQQYCANPGGELLTRNEFKSQLEIRRLCGYNNLF